MWKSSEEGLDEELRCARPAAEFHRDRIRDRIRESVAAREGSPAAPAGRFSRRFGPPARAGLMVAASLIVFVLGAEYGRRTVARVPADSLHPVATGEELPFSIQSAGSHYVASLAELAARVETLSPEQRRLAEEVALTVLYAAIVELGNASGDDGVLRSAAGLVSARRDLLHRGLAPPLDPPNGS